MAPEYIWIILGTVLILAEFMLTSFFIIFFGIAAVVVGLFVWAGMPTTNGLPLLLFAGLSIAMIAFLRSHFRSWFGANAVEGPDGIFEDIIGHEARVAEGFGDAPRGKVDFRGALWSARSEQDLAVGDSVRITARDGITLRVERID